MAIWQSDIGLDARDTGIKRLFQAHAKHEQAGRSLDGAWTELVSCIFYLDLTNDGC